MKVPMSKTPIAVALGDIHLDRRIWTRINGVAGDAEVGYMAFLKVAKDLGVPAIIVGDLFDMAKPPPDLIRIHRKAMDFCAANSVPVFSIQGNHDIQTTAWATATHEHPIHVGDGTVFKLGKHKAIAFDYASMDTIEPKIKSAAVDILFLHQAVRQALGFENSWNADLDWIPNAVKLTVIGDIHKPMDFKLSNGRTACYTGPGHPRDIDQVGPKSVVVIYDDLSYGRVPIPSRPIKQFQVRTEKDLADVATWVGSVSEVEGLKPFAWVLHTTDVITQSGDLQRQCMENGSAFIFREPLVESDEPVVAGAMSADDDLAAPIQLLSKLVDPDKDRELFGFMSDLLNDQRDINDIISERKAC